ncbi:hypothetical protein RJ639_041343 [Escallonia herrerae]|uniref:NADP-dependent oxidoreductase domain-containing protein n=1 Tax=Escallonia herrerae TaxID=1293975 RepID=A0AA89B5C0_9ASTE|nr:hypothetical protein RJ639_041343 [Escallonia herrerae]
MAGAKARTPCSNCACQILKHGNSGEDEAGFTRPRSFSSETWLHGHERLLRPPKPEPDMIELIHRAIEAGVTFLDNSDVYGPHTNEILLGKAFKGGMREKAELATKFGVKFVGEKMEVQGDPGYVRAACEASFKRLQVECVDLYYVHRIDKTVPIEVTVGELRKLFEEGKIKYIGLSEASASTIRRAHAVHPITAVQLEWSLWSREVEEEIVPTCMQVWNWVLVLLHTVLSDEGYPWVPRLLKTCQRLTSERIRHGSNVKISSVLKT